MKDIFDRINEYNASGEKELILYFNSIPVYVTGDFFIRAVLLIQSDEDSTAYNQLSTSAIVVQDSLLVPIFRNAVNTTQIFVSLSEKADTNAFVNYLFDNGFKLNAGFVSAYNTLLSVFSILIIVLLVISLIFALLVIVLLFNFISTSITLTRKQIGILRALGAKKADTFKIFALEGLLVAGIALFAAFVLLIMLAPIVNATVARAFGYYIPLLIFGPLVYFLITVLALGVTLISVLIPLRKFIRITPIDAISDKT